MTTIRCKLKVTTVEGWRVICLPKSVSTKLPSRGMVMIEGVIEGYSFQAPLEPDGKGSHWLHCDKKSFAELNVKNGDDVTLEFEPSKEWPEPPLPTDIKKAIAAHPKAKEEWKSVTPAAKWDWLRWIRSTNNPETRKKRIEVACSKLESGMRRPCCFNRSICTEPAVSKNGILLAPE